MAVTQGKRTKGLAWRPPLKHEETPKQYTPDCEAKAAAAGIAHDPPDNVKAMLALYAREETRATRWHRLPESIGYSVQRPYFVLIIVVFVASWIVINTLGDKLGIASFDAPPFPWRQGIVSLGSLVTATIVLAKQNRAAAHEQRQGHLPLRLTMLTEQKVAKLILLAKELWRDLSLIKDRHDPEAETSKKSPRAETVIDIIEQRLRGKARGAKVAMRRCDKFHAYQQKYPVHKTFSKLVLHNISLAVHNRNSKPAGPVKSPAHEAGAACTSCTMGWQTRPPRNKTSGGSMTKFSVTLYGQTMEESVRKKTEEAFASALESICPDLEILRLMQADEQAALDAGVAHFEDCKSAWQAVCKLATQKAEASLNWRLGSEGYHFDVTFY